jgi:hypothetical protein
MRGIASAVALAALLAVAPAWAGATGRHSGRIVAEDLTHHRLTVEEMGPWHGSVNKALTRDVVTLTPETRIDLDQRSEHPPVGWPGGFVERVLTPADLKTGDFVTVTMARQGGRPVASEVTVVRPSGS